MRKRGEGKKQEPFGFTGKDRETLMSEGGKPGLPSVWCAVCGQQVLATESGKTCVFGHGGAGTTSDPEEADVLRHEYSRERGIAHDASKADRGAELKEEIEKHERPAHQFPRANPGGERELSPPFARIVEKVFVENPEAIYDHLEKQLRIGEKRTDHGTLMKALDEAEDNARWAHRLWITGKIEVERWELDNASVWGAMREEANGALQREKDSKSRSKAITDADVEGMAAIMYPEQYAAQQIKRRRNSQMTKSLENLSQMWESRCRSLNTMLSRQR